MPTSVLQVHTDGEGGSLTSELHGGTAESKAAAIKRLARARDDWASNYAPYRAAKFRIVEK